MDVAALAGGALARSAAARLAGVRHLAGVRQLAAFSTVAADPLLAAAEPDTFASHSCPSPLAVDPMPAFVDRPSWTSAAAHQQRFLAPDPSPRSPPSSSRVSEHASNSSSYEELGVRSEQNPTTSQGQRDCVDRTHQRSLMAIPPSPGQSDIIESLSLAPSQASSQPPALDRMEPLPAVVADVPQSPATPAAQKTTKRDSPSKQRRDSPPRANRDASVSRPLQEHRSHDTRGQGRAVLNGPREAYPQPRESEMPRKSPQQSRSPKFRSWSEAIDRLLDATVSSWRSSPDRIPMKVIDRLLTEGIPREDLDAQTLIRIAGQIKKLYAPTEWTTWTAAGIVDCYLRANRSLDARNFLSSSNLRFSGLYPSGLVGSDPFRVSTASQGHPDLAHPPISNPSVSSLRDLYSRVIRASLAGGNLSVAALSILDCVKANLPVSPDERALAILYYRSVGDKQEQVGSLILAAEREGFLGLLPLEMAHILLYVAPKLESIEQVEERFSLELRRWAPEYSRWQAMVRDGMHLDFQIAAAATLPGPSSDSAGAPLLSPDTGLTEYMLACQGLEPHLPWWRSAAVAQHQVMPGENRDRGHLGHLLSAMLTIYLRKPFFDPGRAARLLTQVYGMVGLRPLRQDFRLFFEKLIASELASLRAAVGKETAGEHRDVPRREISSAADSSANVNLILDVFLVAAQQGHILEAAWYRDLMEYFGRLSRWDDVTAIASHAAGAGVLIDANALSLMVDIAMRQGRMELAGAFVQHMEALLAPPAEEDAAADSVAGSVETAGRGSDDAASSSIPGPLTSSSSSSPPTPTVPLVETVTRMMDYYIKARKPTAALRVGERFGQGRPEVLSRMVRSLSLSGFPAEAESLISTISRQNILDDDLYLNLADAFAQPKTADPTRCRSVLDKLRAQYSGRENKMSSRQVSLMEGMWVKCLARAGRMQEAEEYIEQLRNQARSKSSGWRLPKRLGTYFYSPVVHGYAYVGDGDAALRAARRMIETDRILPNWEMLSAAVRPLLRPPTIKTAVRVWAELLKLVVEGDPRADAEYQDGRTLQASSPFNDTATPRLFSAILSLTRRNQSGGGNPGIPSLGADTSPAAPTDHGATADPGEEATRVLSVLFAMGWNPPDVAMGWFASLWPLRAAQLMEEFGISSRPLAAAIVQNSSLRDLVEAASNVIVAAQDASRTKSKPNSKIRYAAEPAKSKRQKRDRAGSVDPVKDPSSSSSSDLAQDASDSSIFDGSDADGENHAPFGEMWTDPTDKESGLEMEHVVRALVRVGSVGEATQILRNPRHFLHRPDFPSRAALRELVASCPPEGRPLLSEFLQMRYPDLMVEQNR